MTGVILLTITGVVLAIAIGLVTKYFGVKQNPLAEKLLAIMPGANCGGCGFAGCADYVDAMVTGRAAPGRCPSMNEDAMKVCSKLLGRDVEKTEPMVAVVACSGDDNHAVRRGIYNGITDCRNAMIVAGGGKGCLFGCLGMGTCARACPFGAIEMTERHIAVVHPELCTGCGSCAAVCPRHVIKLVPRTSKIHVFCSSPESAKVKMPVCSGACIGCKKCARNSQEGQMTFNGFLACVNYENAPDQKLEEVCPTKALRSHSITEE